MFCNDLEGKDGGLGGRLTRKGMYVGWLIHAVVWQKLTQHCKAVFLKLKKKKKRSLLSWSFRSRETVNNTHNR